MTRIALIGPTSRPLADIADEVAADVRRLTRPGVEVEYRTTGAGPLDIHSDEDARQAAPHVVSAVVDAAHAGFDAVIIDCTSDPGLAAARAAVVVPVVGAGEALAAAVERSPDPVVVLSGDVLRGLDEAAVVARATGAATIALGGTGWSHLVPALRTAHPGAVVLDPLDVALEQCLTSLSG